MAASVDYRNLPALQAFAATAGAWEAFLVEVEKWIFEDLASGSDSVGSITGQITAASQLSTDKPDYLDGRAEVASRVAAAAAAEKKSYDNLVALVQGLANAWPGFVFQVAKALLLRFPNQANFFLLKLIEAGVLDPVVIYNYVKVQWGQRNPASSVVLAYFLPELIALQNNKFIIDSWRGIVTDKSPNSVADLILPEELKTVTQEKVAEAGIFDAFKAARAKGEHPAPVVAAIRADDVQAFMPHAATNDYTLTIPFSLYEGFLHFEWTIEPEGGDQNQNKFKFRALPTYVDAIALLDASQCFDTVLTAPREAVEKALEKAGSSLLGAGSGQGILARAVNAGAKVKPEHLVTAVRLHQQGSLEWAVETDGVTVTDAVLGATAVYANFTAFKLFNDANRVADRFAKDVTPTFLHYIARGNAVTLFKLFLSQPNLWNKDANAPRPKAKTGSDRTFLHWAANYGADEVVAFWVKALGLKEGLDVRDKLNQFPADIAGARGIYEQRKTKARLLRDVNPLYNLLLEATDSAADAAVASAGGTGRAQ
jgi:hypothetical protein